MNLDLSSNGPAGEELAELRDRLASADYSTARVRELLNIPAPVDEIISNTGRYSLVMMDDLGRMDAPCAILAQLFLFAGRVTAKRFERLSPALVDLLRRRGFVASVPGAPELVLGTVAITEYQGAMFLSHQLFENRGREFVVSTGTCMPFHASSLELWHGLTPPPAATSFLDVGCGSGCQSILGKSRYRRIAGFDLDPRSVEFAGANASMNGVSARYSVGDFATFRDPATYDHVALNSPSCEGAFPFINNTLDAVLAPGGRAQIWSQFEVTAREGSLIEALRARIPTFDRWTIDIAVQANSTRSLSRDAIRTRSIPRNSLVVDQPGQQKAYLDDLAARGVSEVAVAILTIDKT
jgi:protein-L-isoaspartate O-methyltransferase